MRISILTGEGVIEKLLPVQEDRIRSLIKCGFRCFDYNFIPMYREKILLEDNWKELLAGTKNLIDEYGVTYGQGHLPGGSPGVEAFLEDEHSWDRYFEVNIRRVFDVAKFLNIPYLVIHPIAVENNTREEFLENNRKMMRKFLPFIEETGIMLLMENVGIPGSPYLVYSGAELAEVIDYIDHPMFGACWDTGHANHHSATYSQYDSIAALGERLKALHVHDNFGCHQGMDDSHWWRDFHSIPFIGTTNFDEIMTALLEIGYKGTFSLETVFYKDLSDKKKFIKNGVLIDKVALPSLELIEEEHRHQYNIAKYILSQYGCYEY